MRVTVNIPLPSYDGTPVIAETGKILTLRSACCEALLVGHRADTDLPAEEKVGRWRLATRIARKDEVDLTAEEVALVKDLIARRYSAAVVGPAWEMLDPPPDGEGLLPLVEGKESPSA